MLLLFSILLFLISLDFFLFDINKNVISNNFYFYFSDNFKMPLFGKSQKSPAEVVKALKEAVNALERGDKKVEKVSIFCF